MKRMFAVALCLLMLVAMTACGTAHNHNHSVPPKGDVQTVPSAQNAKGSLFIGTWSVTAETSPLYKLEFHEDGTLRAFFDTSSLGGVFFDDGSKLSLHISQKTIEGTYTVDGDTVTLVTADDTLVFKKA